MFGCNGPWQHALEYCSASDLCTTGSRRDFVDAFRVCLCSFTFKHSRKHISCLLVILMLEVFGSTSYLSLAIFETCHIWNSVQRELCDILVLLKWWPQLEYNPFFSKKFHMEAIVEVCFFFIYWLFKHVHVFSEEIFVCRVIWYIICWTVSC